MVARSVGAPSRSVRRRSAVLRVAAVAAAALVVVAASAVVGVVASVAVAASAVVVAGGAAAVAASGAVDVATAEIAAAATAGSSGRDQRARAGAHGIGGPWAVGPAASIPGGAPADSLLAV